MGKLRKLTTKLLSITLAAVMSLFAGISAYAAPAYEWGVNHYAANPDDRYGWIGNGSTKFYADNTVHTPGSEYSIKLENTKYNTGCVEKTYKVEPKTRYKFSAMVKYSGYQAASYAESGACLGEAYVYNPANGYYTIPYGSSGFTTSSDWTLLEYEFTTGNETTHGLRLQNGECKGTAWFSDIKLEKAEMTNSWNILAVFFKNVDANVVLNGKQVHYKHSLRESDISEMNEFALDTLPANLKALSNGRMTVNSIDRFYSDEVLTEKDLTIYENGYCVSDINSPVLSKVLDKYLAQKHYNQIIIFVPFTQEDGISLAGGWWGLGGTAYNGVYFAQITTTWQGGFEKGDKFIGQVAVHEMCHCLENSSKNINPGKTPNFHSVLNDYPDSSVSYYERVHKFMTATLSGGKGLDPSVFNVTSGKYSLVSNDMTIGEGIAPVNSSAAPSAPKNFLVKSVSDTGVNISWDAVANVSGYELAIFKSADFKETWQTFDCAPNQSSTGLGPITKGKPYYYGIRAYYTVNGAKVYSDWTTYTYTHNGVGVAVRGDIDNSGALDIDDISLAVDYFFDRTKLDKRTAECLNITGRDYIDLSDIEILVDWLFESF